MAFRRKRKSVRWLPDTSAFAAMTRIQIPNPNWVGPPSRLPLLETTGGLPYAFAPGDQFRSEALSPDNLILDHLKGKLSWNIESNSGGEGADASGIWRYFIRTAIVVLGRTPTPGSVQAEDLTGTDVAVLGGDVLWNLDPGATVPISTMGSLVPDGVRVLWRRNYFLSIDWEAGAQATGTLVSNEDAAPPGPYLDIKPRRILKATERIDAVVQVTTIGGPGAAGTSALCWSPDVRIAAHNTTRRR